MKKLLMLVVLSAAVFGSDNVFAESPTIIERADSDVIVKALPLNMEFTVVKSIDLGEVVFTVADELRIDHVIVEQLIQGSVELEDYAVQTLSHERQSSLKT